MNVEVASPLGLPPHYGRLEASLWRKHVILSKLHGPLTPASGLEDSTWKKDRPWLCFSIWRLFPERQKHHTSFSLLPVSTV